MPQPQVADDHVAALRARLDRWGVPTALFQMVREDDELVLVAAGADVGFGRRDVVAAGPDLGGAVEGVGVDEWDVDDEREGEVDGVGELAVGVDGLAAGGLQGGVTIRVVDYGFGPEEGGADGGGEGVAPYVFVLRPAVSSVREYAVV